MSREHDVNCREIKTPLVRHFLVAACLLSGSAAYAAENISPLADPPKWESLEKYQETITRDEFVRRLEQVYCNRGANPELIQVEPDQVRIRIERPDEKWFTLRFAPNESKLKRAANYWRPARQFRPARKGRELSGLKVALDPGHIGGRWARMEERWFQVGESKPVQEGDMTLRVARLLAPKLRARGAVVSFVRKQAAPVTKKRPADFREISRQVLARAGVAQPREDFDGPADPAKDQTLRWQNEILFYRYSEIRARAARVNSRIKPDIVLCLHFNAEAWDDPRNPTLIDRNHLHMLVNGSYLPPELELDDVRFEMIRRLLSRAYDEELPLADKAAAALASRTGLPAYEYTTENVLRVGSSGYVYARNLLATRLYQCPVIYFEPYVMNSHEVHERVQAGDYPGLRFIAGRERPSIYREYADGVLDGLLDYYRAARGTPAEPLH
ncbi:MAG TPA: hypothetical protein VG095_01650 [Chthoniobacterales bacterium]|nr:hypothetical protein [Chthoniobacterales bacterium]